jgi:glyoxylase-like metal-dependent hydrolase (beta-lactamase superfamily II)
MLSLKTRREFCQTIIGCFAGAGAVFSRAPVFAQESTDRIVARDLGDGYVLLSGAGGNVLALNTDEGTLLVDGGAPERSSDLLEMVAAQPGAGRVEVLFNTHWHLEHTGSNDTLGSAGATIIAQENTRLWMGREIIVEWQDKVYPARRPEALPNKTFYNHESPQNMTFGGRSIEYGHLFQAHTDGDIYVYFPEPNILMAGDTVAVGHYPILDYSTHGWIGGMANASEDLLEIADENTRIVPGTGPIQTRADLEAQSEMLSTIRQRVVGMIRMGYSAEDMLANNATEDYDAKWGDPEMFVRSIYPGLWGHVREIGGIV